MRLSYWEQQSLIGSPEVVIIGAGIVGLTTARLIATNYPSLSVVVLEGQSIGALASSRNAGFACFGSVSELMSDIDRYGEEQVVEIVKKRRKGLEALINFTGTDAVNYNNVGGYEIFRDQHDYERYADNISYLNHLLSEDVFDTCEIDNSLRFHPMAIRNRQEGHLDTGKMYQRLFEGARDVGIRILNGIRVSQILKKRSNVEISVIGMDTPISADKVLITTNALAKDLIGELDVSPCRNQVIVTDVIPNHKLRGTFHLDEGYVYFRDVGDRILIGGGRHLFPEENTGIVGANAENIQYLKAILSDYILPPTSNFNVEYAWSGVLSGGDNRLPIVQKIDDHTTVAVRLGGMGVAIGSIIATELATLAFD